VGIVSADVEAAVADAAANAATSAASGLAVDDGAPFMVLLACFACVVLQMRAFCFTSPLQCVRV
jgi:hypothetical protein